MSTRNNGKIHLAKPEKEEEPKKVPCMVCKSEMTVPLPEQFELMNGPNYTVAIFRHEPFACPTCQSVYVLQVPEGSLRSSVSLELLVPCEPLVTLPS